MNASKNDWREEVLADILVDAPSTSEDGKACLAPPPEDPCSIVIMGATGDLTARKLMPSLLHMFQNKRLPDAFAIVGSGRTRLDDVQFRDRMASAIEDHAISDRSQWNEFAERIFYQPVDYDDPQTFETLAGRLADLDQRHQLGGNRLIYLALPPDLYATVAQMTGKAGLGDEQRNKKTWSRLVVEKPFGRDLNSAIELDRHIHEYFQENQIYRIDHYLAKETVQNVLMFRFANAIFEPIWNRRYIDYVEINALETLGVEHRAGYYEKSGVLRDMFQNHMMQLLALTAMEPPSAFKDDRVRDERVKLFRALRPFDPKRQNEQLVLGQYGQGVVGGRNVRAYRDESDVDPTSLTPTYARMKVHVDNWRWQGVPFYLTSGKRLKKKITRIAIQFKQVPHSMFRDVIGSDIRANRLVLGIYPEEKITLTFQTKMPGAQTCLRSVTMDFHYYQGNQQPVLDAYEKVLLDCMRGDHMLFWRQDAVKECWSFLTPILTECETCKNQEDLLHMYPSGSSGPDAAARL